MPAYATLGTDLETGEPLWIGDIERCGGLYVLGKPRTGKSHTLISLALQDIARGLGLLFIDPHADAIQAILDRMPMHRINDVILLDPTDSDYAFGINPLYCDNPHDLRERQLTFGQTWDVFAKVFAEENERLGILLSKYLGNCLYPLIEHQGYTLYDLWYFLTNQSFREFVLSKGTYHPEVVEFWHDAYEWMLPRHKKEEPQSLLNRIDAMRRNPYIKHVIGQATPTIDFVKVMQTQKIVLLRMPPWQDSESKAFIGTLVISQLLKAIFLRAEVSEHLRTPFAIYCDEFQMFSTPDFAKLFTQTGKYRVMPAVAHQDRVGQFKPDDPNRGATMVALIKVIFSASVPDSHEVAPEFAKPPPTEIKLERQLVISQEPVQDLLRGHTNPEIRAFVNRYLRPLPYRMEDTQANIEAQRMKRLDYLDEAALDRIDLQMVTDGVSRHQIASAATREVQLAKNQTVDMLALHDYAQGLRQGLRELNHFFTALMEGQIAPGQGSFSAFLLNRISTFSAIRPTLVPVLQLYISLSYGDPNYSPPLPFTFAKMHGFFPEVINALQQDAEEKVHREQEDMKERALEEYKRRTTADMAAHKRLKEKLIADDWLNFSHPMIYPQPGAGRKASRQPMDFENTGVGPVESRFLKEYKRIYHNPRFMALLSPYSTARFAEPWVNAFPHYRETKFDLLEVIRQERLLTLSTQESNTFWKIRSKRNKPVIDRYFRGEPDLGFPLQPRYDLDYLDEVEQFVRKDEKGALVIFALLMTLENPLRWRRFRQKESLLDKLNTMHLPTLVNREPLEIFLLLSKLDELLPDYKHRFSHMINTWEEDINRHLNYEFNGAQLSVLLAQSHDERVRQGWWAYSEKPVQVYLMARAYHIALNSQSIANQTFPQPTLQGISPDEVANMVSFMVNLLREEKERIETQRLQNKLAEHEKHIQQNIDKRFIGKSLPVPAYLPARSLSPAERETIRQACLTELVQNGHGAVIHVIADFVQFCELLARPENHVKTQSGQYVEVPSNSRVYRDMNDEMAHELINLPRFTAYAKVIQEVNGTQIVRKAKIETCELDQPLAGIDVGGIARKNAIDAGILRKRSVIDEEIIQRQTPWRSRPDDEPPLLPTGGDKPPLPPKRPTTNSEPPSTHYIPSQTPENTLPESRVIPSQPSRIDTNKSSSKKVSPRGKILDITPRLPKRQEEVGNKRKTQKNLSNAKNLHDGTINRQAQTLRVSLPYVDDSIEKVTYVIKGGFFNLIIRLKDRILYPKEKIVFTTGDYLPVLDEKQIQDMQQLKGRPRKELIITLPCQSDPVQKVDYTVSGNYLHINIHGSIASSFYKSKIRFPRCLPG